MDGRMFDGAFSLLFAFFKVLIPLAIIGLLSLGVAGIWLIWFLIHHIRFV